MSSSSSSDVSMTSSIESFFDEEGVVHPFRFEPDADDTEANDDTTTNNTQQQQAQQPVKVSRPVVVRTYSRM